jgi:muramidase (phage lysozyme)
LANFNLGLETTKDPDYSGESRLDRSVFVDRTGAAAAEDSRRKIVGITNAVGNIFDTVNYGIEKAAESAVKEGVEPIRNEQGGDVYGLEGQSQNNAQPVGMPPQGVTRYAEGMTKLKAQYDQGVITDSRYYEQLEVLTRQVKARFPGYEDHIDKTIHRITGVTPANALRNARMEELKATASDSQREAEKQQTFLRQNIEYLPAGWETRPFEENQEHIRLGKRAKEDIDRKIAEFNLKDKERSASDDEKKKLANSIAADTRDEFRRVTQPILDEAIAKIDAGKSIDPTEAAGLVKAYEFNLQTALYRKLSKMTLPDGEYDRLVNAAMGDVKSFEMAMISGDASMLKQNKLIVEAMGDEQFRKLYQDSPLAQKVELLRRMPQGIQQAVMLDQGTKLVGPVLDTLGLNKAGIPGSTANAQELPKATQGALNLFKVDNATSHLGESMAIPQMTPIEQIDKLAQLPGGATAKAMQAYVNDWVRLMTDEKLPDDLKAGVTKRFFSEENFDFLKKFRSASDKQAVYRAFTSPKVVAEMQKHKGPEYDRYSAWVKQNFHHVFKSEIDNLADIPNRPYVNLEFNESTGKFLLTPTEEGRRVGELEARKAGRMSLAGATMNQIERLYNQAPLEKSVNELNSVMENVKPIVEGEGFTFQQEVKNLIHFEATHDKKNSTFWQWFLKGASKESKDESFGGLNINFSEASRTPGGINQALDALKSSFAKGESGEDYNRLVNKKGSKEAFRAPLTGMTVSEVLAYQEDMKASGHLSSAAGKYQILKGTLRSLVREGAIKLEDKYDEATQEKAAEALLERRGLSDYLAGKIPLTKFMRNLGDEWEILKKSPTAYHKTMKELEVLKAAGG